MESLGFPKYVYDFVSEVIQRPNGIFVVTGPTGCGKTTTLYSCLRRVNTIDSKLLTAEDPVEFDIEGIMQVAINEGVGHDLQQSAALLSCVKTRTSSWSVKCATWKRRRSPFKPRSPVTWC
ncbi:MAG: ATPase, T2SS/T4P/T4SS family [Verrucomicrobiota bacterium]